MGLRKADGRSARQEFRRTFQLLSTQSTGSPVVQTRMILKKGTPRWTKRSWRGRLAIVGSNIRVMFRPSHGGFVGASKIKERLVASEVCQRHDNGS